MKHGYNNNNNKRMRNRNNNNNNRRGNNQSNRSFESNGPDVKIRGTAHHIAEKYLQLARDAQGSGDRVMAENYMQHAEHYFRTIIANQQAMGLTPHISRSDMDEPEFIEGDEEGVEFENEGNAPQPDVDGAIEFEGQPVAKFNPRNRYQNQENQEDNEQMAQPRQYQDRQGERQNGDRQNRYDRPRYNNRDDRNQDRNQERSPERSRDDRPRDDRPREERPERTYDNPRPKFTRRDSAPQDLDPTQAEQPALPAFLRTPVAKPARTIEENIEQTHATAEPVAMAPRRKRADRLSEKLKTAEVESED